MREKRARQDVEYQREHVPWSGLGELRRRERENVRTSGVSEVKGDGHGRSAPNEAAKSVFFSGPGGKGMGYTTVSELLI